MTDPQQTPLEQLAALQADNERRLQGFSSQGVQMDMSGVLLIRIAQLAEHLLGAEGTAERTVYELRVQTAISNMMDTAEKEIRKSRLLQGITLRDPRNN